MSCYWEYRSRKRGSTRKHAQGERLMTDEHNCPVDIPDAGLRKGLGKAPGDTVTRDSGVWTRPATTSNYDVRQGRTCFGGTRLPVDHLFRHLAAGGTIEGFLENHDHVKREQVVATIKRAGYVLVARAPERRRYLRERRARWCEEREFDDALPPRDEPHRVRTVKTA